MLLRPIRSELLEVKFRACGASRRHAQDDLTAPPVPSRQGCGQTPTFPTAGPREVAGVAEVEVHRRGLGAQARSWSPTDSRWERDGTLLRHRDGVLLWLLARRWPDF